MAIERAPEPIDSRARQAGWIPLQRLGEGGGGVVYLCAKAGTIKAIEDVIRVREGGTAFREPEKTLEICSTFLRSLSAGLVGERDALSALKIPKALDDPETRERLKREISAMKAVSHPSLIRLLGSDDQEQPEWFVMEYHRPGALTNSVARYHKNIPDALKAIRPVVEGIGKLHDKGYVHRDIKPNNIFQAENGSLVLGDFGIVFPREKGGERLTDTGMTLFSRDWIPDWTRFSDSAPQPKVDVFMLAKVLYYMVTGGRKVLASQLDEQDFDLRFQMKEVEGAGELQQFMMTCITTKEGNCKLETASELLARVDELMGWLSGSCGPELVFNFLSPHSTTNISITQNPNYPKLTGIQVLFPRKYKTLRARAKLLGPTRGVKIDLFFSIDSSRSNACEHIELHPDKGTWTEEFRLEKAPPFERGWHVLDVMAKAEIDGVQICGFTVYGE